MVKEAEYRDLQNLMNLRGLFEMENKGDYFTWSNKHVEGMIYSRIDRVLGNTNWFLTQQDTTLIHLSPSVSDHNLHFLDDNT